MLNYNNKVLSLTIKQFLIMKRQVLFSNEPFEITDELRKEFLESMGHEGTDEGVGDTQTSAHAFVGVGALKLKNKIFS